jgi:hypothetical protein
VLLDWYVPTAIIDERVGINREKGEGEMYVGILA